MKGRFCKTELQHTFIDLINSPASNSFLTLEQLNEPETFYPLKVFTCHKCFLVQVDEYKKPDDIFNSEYVYFSSYSTSWLQHAKQYAGLMIERFGFNEKSQVVEINNESIDFTDGMEQTMNYELFPVHLVLRQFNYETSNM